MNSFNALHVKYNPHSSPPHTFQANISHPPQHSQIGGGGGGSGYRIMGLPFRVVEDEVERF